MPYPKVLTVAHSGILLLSSRGQQIQRAEGAFVEFKIYRLPGKLPAGFFILLILWLPTGSFADTELKFQWDPNPEPDIAGYRVFSRLEGQDYDYHQPDWDGQDTECTIYVEDGETPYHFVVRAYDLDGFESADSNEVRYPNDDLNRNLGAGTGDSEVGCFTDAVSE